MEQIDSTNVTALGGSLFVRLPSRVCKLMEIKKGTPMIVYREGNQIIFEQKVSRTNTPLLDTL